MGKNDGPPIAKKSLSESKFNLIGGSGEKAQKLPECLNQRGTNGPGRECNSTEVSLFNDQKGFEGRIGENSR